MSEGRSYSIGDLQKLSGFDRRTIVYYSQQGLLPRSGRRGPRTRHPHLVLQRLLFIRGLKDLQDQGYCGTITLRDMGRMLDQLAPNALRDLLDRGIPSVEIERLLQGPVAAGAPAAATAPPPVTAATQPTAESPAPHAPAPQAAATRTVGDGRRYGLADAGIRQRHGVATPQPPPATTGTAAPPAELPPTAVAPTVPAPLPANLPEDLGELLRELEIRPSLGARRVPPGGSELWTEIPVTSRVYLSVRGLAPEDAPLADATGRALKKLLRR